VISFILVPDSELSSDVLWIPYHFVPSSLPQYSTEDNAWKRTIVANLIFGEDREENQEGLRVELLSASAWDSKQN
jgi:hypothetical protein